MQDKSWCLHPDGPSVGFLQGKELKTEFFETFSAENLDCELCVKKIDNGILTELIFEMARK